VSVIVHCAQSTDIWIRTDSQRDADIVMFWVVWTMIVLPIIASMLFGLEIYLIAKYFSKPAGGKNRRENGLGNASGPRETSMPMRGLSSLSDGGSIMADAEDIPLTRVESDSVLLVGKSMMNSAGSAYLQVDAARGLGNADGNA
jgi:hypothetical protein